MEIRCSTTLFLMVVLLYSITVESQENWKSDEKENSNSKISASLKIHDGSKGVTNKTNQQISRTTEKQDNTRNTPASQKLIRQRNETIGFELSSNKNNRINETRPLILSTDRNIRKMIPEDNPDEREIEDDDEDEDEENTEEGEETTEEVPEHLPEAQELRYMRPGSRKRPVYRPIRRLPATLNRRNVHPDPPKSTSKRPARRPEFKRGPTDRECTFFTKTVCLEAVDYPLEAILRSLRNNKDMVSALLTDYKIQDYKMDEKLSGPASVENNYENRYENNEIKRLDFSSSFDNIEEGFTCPSVVKYARPQLARAASGIWKYIINTGEHTQTLRLEKCSTPRSSCSFISENYRSSCKQVYNYHRLLTWDSKIGLHMDIFKVPTCCNCHVHGYSELFPPHQKDPSTKKPEVFPGLDFATTSEDHKEFDEFLKPSGTKYPHKYAPHDNNFPSFVDHYSPRPGPETSFSETHYSVSSVKKPILEPPTSNRPPPSFSIPNRNRPKRPPPNHPRPFDKVPQQHAPNTRAPGYKGPLTKLTNRPSRPSRPFRRESTLYDSEILSTNSTTTTRRYSEPFDQDIDASSRLQNGGFDDEYQEPHKRINYNYHPIIDFFKPEASMLQSVDSPLTPTTQRSSLASSQTDSNSWQPMLSP